ncbi:MAG: gliding motility lipoprotein GldD [Bacteroidetes bacterium]|jgi:gliding motility-associated lipoprotein GldD|nr:MAG: gliding motility lipoprotein GldD [Bacteroidota bacterium]UCE69157.1 MAG: gliding motility lipoprotein GldD [Flavobacteriaceae bacterium]
MKLKHFFLIALVSSVFMSCGGDPVPKPKAMLRLDYPVQAYRSMQSGCPFTFDFNRMADSDLQGGCNMVLDYKPMKGSIYLTYKPVEGNLRELLTDAQKLSYEHAVKADNILEQPYVNQQDRVFGMFYEVKGDAASQSQFYVTDSLNHFVTGSLYFYAKPNYDSIFPAAIYLQKDIRRIMESLRWQ